MIKKKKIQPHKYNTMPKQLYYIKMLLQRFTKH